MLAAGRLTAGDSETVFATNAEYQYGNIAMEISRRRI
jgi:hypothetical protein